MNTLKKEILDSIQTLDVCIPSTRGIQWLIRCPFCGDSIHQDHAHLSLKIDLESDEPILYRCLKCNEYGIFDENLLELINLNIDKDTISELKNFNKSSRKNKKFNISSMPYSVPYGGYNKKNYEKLKYVNDRIDAAISFEEAINLKIVFDIYEFMKYNELDYIPDISEKFLEFVNNNYVGFLSNNNARLVFRCIRNNKDMQRYIKLNIDPDCISNNNFYTINQQIDLTYKEPQDIHICEGIFDILSVLYNIKDKNLTNNIYYASTGFNYLTVLKHVLNTGIIHSNNIHIYSDNDKSDKDHKKYLNRINKLWFDNIYIHRNTYNNEKDYGVPKDKIIDSYYKLI